MHKDTMRQSKGNSNPTVTNWLELRTPNHHFTRLPTATPNPDIGSRRLARDPLDETRNLRVRGKRFDRTVVAGKLRLSKQAVDLLVAGTAEKSDR